MRSNRRFSTAFAALFAATAALAACSNSGRDPRDADALRGEIDAAMAQDFGLTVGREFVERERNVRVRIASFDMMPGWANDDHAAALRSFQRSCDKILNMRSAATLGGLSTRIEDWRTPCLAARDVDPRAARQFFELGFVPVRLAPNERALVTSYFEPELRASRTPGGEFVHPLYAKPPELITEGGEYGVLVGGRLQPFFSRAEIYRGALSGRGLEIAYLDDATDSFFLHVQGSGRLRFTDGSTTRVAFSAKNGHPFGSPGREMVRRGLAPRGGGSAAQIREYVRANPAAGLDLLSANKSFIFFREVTNLDPNVGPIGALGVQLSDGRSIAVDRRYTTLGAPVWLTADNSPTGPIRRLVVAQDTGSAIRGVQRADLFWGTGDEAGAMAGRMRHPGDLTILLPAPTVRRLSGR